MDGLILADKLDSLRRCLERIEARRAETPEELARDPDRQDIVSLNLARAVQLCVDMAVHVLASRGRAGPRTMGEAFDQLADERLVSAEVCRSMRAAMGFRNVAVHSYRSIDWRIVHSITHERLGDFRAFAAAIAGLIED
jgi:uncharacterized protein YutE (UPF0331/DUF86 family)